MVEALRRSITLDDAESDCRIVDVELPRLREIARQPHTQSTPMGCCGRNVLRAMEVIDILVVELPSRRILEASEQPRRLRTPLN